MGVGRGGIHKPWTEEERRELLVQHNSGVAITKLSLPNRSQKACVQEYYRMQNPDTRPTARRRIASSQPIAPSPEEAASLAERIKRPRYIHEGDMHIVDRIARQGLTAGFLGDPPPGRSALDVKGAGCD